MKKSIAVLISVLLLVGAVPVSPRRSAQLKACGYEEEPEVNFFQPAVIEELASTPFFYSPHYFYDDERVGGLGKLFSDVNVAEWHAFFRQAVTREDLTTLLYRTDLPAVDTLIRALRGESVQVPQPLAANSILRFPDKPLAVKFLYYLGFAKRCEPIATAREGLGWWEEEKPEDKAARTAQALKLIAGGQKLLGNVEDPFLKGRYHFQVLRLQFYAGDYPACSAYWDLNQAAFTTESLKFRAMNFAAGALYRQKLYARANYLFSLIFDRYPPLRRMAYLSFRPVEEADWRQSLALAQSTREKAVLWQLLGIYADGPRAMKEIYALDPKSDLLPLLVVREVNRQEKTIVPQLEPPGLAKTEVPRVPPELLAFLEQAVAAGQVRKIQAWQLALAHLYGLDRRRETAEKYLALAAAAPAGPEVKDQLRLTGLIIKVLALPRPEPAMEPTLTTELDWLAEGAFGSPRSAFQAWLRPYLSKLYAAAGDETRALLLFDQPGAPFYRDNGKLDGLLAFLARPEPSPFDQKIGAAYPYSRENLLELKALNFLYTYRFKDAAAVFNQLQTSEDQPLYSDPFTIHINDCHDCDASVPTHREYTKAGFAARLATLFEQAGKPGAGQAAACFELANGLYNMSWYGNARDVYYTPNSNFAYDERHFDCSQAEKYYRQAMAVSKDREFQAKACFMAAKCEQNRYFRTKDYSYGKPDFVAGEYFRKLKSTYADTAYYREIIQECGYFRTFAAKP